ncbi:FadR/GntR family transcriptional regulator [Bacillus sp. JJ1532]|uniref:FadR/GntR family transcriptional regulator n=1 Tax=Bacillus sp. JJ1532 TaxID=3122958 RepID=UPI002FFE188E
MKTGDQMNFEPINKNNRMFEQVLDRLKYSITSGDLSPGDKLMTEREMASTLQVSRSSVREALRILEIFDVIQSKPGEGTILKKPDVPKIITKILPFMTISKDANLELFESRRVLEGGIVKLAAKRRKERDLKNLEESISRMMGSKGLEERINADLDFHLYLAKAAYNNTLSDILIVVADVVSQNLYAIGFQIHSNDEVNSKIIEQHQRILNAIKDKSPELASQEMENHLTFEEKIIEEWNE